MADPETGRPDWLQDKYDHLIQLIQTALSAAPDLQDTTGPDWLQGRFDYLNELIQTALSSAPGIQEIIASAESDDKPDSLEKSALPTGFEGAGLPTAVDDAHVGESESHSSAQSIPALQNLEASHDQLKFANAETSKDSASFSGSAEFSPSYQQASEHAATATQVEGASHQVTDSAHVTADTVHHTADVSTDLNTGDSDDAPDANDGSDDSQEAPDTPDDSDGSADNDDDASDDMADDGQDDDGPAGTLGKMSEFRSSDHDSSSSRLQATTGGEVTHAGANSADSFEFGQGSPEAHHHVVDVLVSVDDDQFTFAKPAFDAYAIGEDDSSGTITAQHTHLGIHDSDLVLT
jgi:hypothetical protein